MKIRYLVGILMIILLVGCTSQVETPPAETPPAEVVETPPAEVETPAEEEEIVGGAIATTEVDVTSGGFDPIEIEVSAGDTITLTSTDKVLHIIRGNDLFPPRKLFRAGNQYMFTIEEAGEYEILDQTARSTLKITASALEITTE